MTDAKDIEAVVAEFWQPKKGITEAFTDAARLILEARTHAGYEQWRAEFDVLRADRDAAKEEAERLIAERDAALRELEKYREVLRNTEDKLDGCLTERDAAIEEAAQWARQHHQLGTELDKALARVQELEGLSMQIQGVHVDWIAEDRKHRERITHLEAEGAATREMVLGECARHMARIFCERCAYENNQWLRDALRNDGGVK